MAPPRHRGSSGNRIFAKGSDHNWMSLGHHALCRKPNARWFVHRPGEELVSHVAAVILGCLRVFAAPLGQLSEAAHPEALRPKTGDRGRSRKASRKMYAHELRLICDIGRSP